jgi:hypothetical protein
MSDEINFWIDTKVKYTRVFIYCGFINDAVIVLFILYRYVRQDS